jgi:hypothetical protein
MQVCLKAKQISPTSGGWRKNDAVLMTYGTTRATVDENFVRISAGEERDGTDALESRSGGCTGQVE